MIDTKLILIEGIPGSGKTSAARFICNWLESHGRRPRLFLEGDWQHPADFESVACLDDAEYARLRAQFPALVLIALNCIWVSLVFGVLATRYRDISPLLGSLVQLLFFMTPIIWRLGPEVGNKVGSRARLVELNPLYHYIEITRGPLLGEHVAFYHWGIVMACTVVGCAAALLVLRNYRSRVAYWV